MLRQGSCVVTQCVASLHEYHFTIKFLVINPKYFHVNCLNVIHIGLCAIYFPLPLIVFRVHPSQRTYTTYHNNQFKPFRFLQQTIIQYYRLRP